MTSYADVLVAQAGPYMLAARAKDIIEAEVAKGCEPTLWPQPVELEPYYSPITAARDCRPSDQIAQISYQQPANSDELIRFKVWLSPQQVFRWDRCELFLKQLAGVSHRIAFEISGNSAGIEMFFLCHRQDKAILQTSFAGKMNSCALTAVSSDSIETFDQDVHDQIYFYDFFPMPPYFHLFTRPDELHDSSYESLIAAISAIEPPAKGLCQMVFEPVKAEHLWHRNIQVLMDLDYAIKQINNIGILQRYAQQSPSGDLRMTTNRMETKAHNDKPFFAVAVRLAAAGGQDCQKYLESLAVFMSLFQHGGRQLAHITGSEYERVLSKEQIAGMFAGGLAYRNGFLLNSEELAGLVHIPPAEIFEKIEIPYSRLEPLSIAIKEPSAGTPIGTCTIAGKETPVCIPEKLRLGHTHLIGRPGMGKSTLIEHMILDDIVRGHGVAVIDPHGDMVQRLLMLIEEQYIEKVIFLDPGDRNWIPLWNPLSLSNDHDIGRVADDFVGVIKSFVSGWGDRMEHLLRHAFFALLHIQGSTFNDVNDILRMDSKDSQRLQKLVLDVVDNEVARRFWQHDFARYKPDDMGPPKHRLSKLLLSDTVGLMLSQPRSALDIARVMNEAMVLLVDLSTVGTEFKDTLGGLLLAIMHMTALARSRKNISDRKPFHIYVDEAHHFVTDSLEDIIAQTRKYGVSLTLAHQYMNQFTARQADALSSVSTTVAFNVDTRDSTFLAKDFQKKATVEDFITLNVGEALVRIGTNVSKINTLKPMSIWPGNNREKIIEYSRQRYYRSAVEVKAMIAQRYGKNMPNFTTLVPADCSGNPIIAKGRSYDAY